MDTNTTKNRIELMRHDQEIILEALQNYLELLTDTVNHVPIATARMAIYRQRHSVQALLKKLDPENTGE